MVTPEDLVKSLICFSTLFMIVGGIFCYFAYSIFERAIKLMETLTDMAWRIFIHVNMDTEQEEADNAESTDD